MHSFPSCSPLSSLCHCGIPSRLFKCVRSVEFVNHYPVIHNLLSFYAVPRALHHHPSHGNDAQQNRSCKLPDVLKGESPSHHLSLAHVKEVLTSMESVKRVRCWASLLCLLRGICLSYCKDPTFAQTGDATGVSKYINILLQANVYGTHLHFYLYVGCL